MALTNRAPPALNMSLNRNVLGAAIMGRRATKNLNLPAGMRARHRRAKVWYYYEVSGDARRREIPLGNDYALALKQWVELQGDAAPVQQNLMTFDRVAGLWEIKELHKLAPKTQKGYLGCLRKLREFFVKAGLPVPLEAITPQNVQQFMTWREDEQHAPIQATREKAVLSLIWNWARGKGYTAKANPCAGVKGTKSQRQVYIEDNVFQAVWNVADVPLREALDLAYLTGQRPADTLKIRERDIRDDLIAVKQNKTGHKLRMEIVGELDALIERIKARKSALTSTVVSLALIVDESGKTIRQPALRYRFDQARLRAIEAHPELAAEIREFQFRDLRAKAGTDTAEATDIRTAQKQLGHAHIQTTEIYVRNRRGDKVKPTK